MTAKNPENPYNETNTDLRKVLIRARNLDLNTRALEFEAFWQAAVDARVSLYFREILGPSDREVAVRDPFTGQERRMLMFGSNNYLGLANDPSLHTRVEQVLETFGAGLGGPPLLNGYTTLLRTLEERLAAAKHCESAVVFPTGYQANLGLATCLMDRDDLLLYDEAHHASLYDGMRMSRVTSESFPHNDVASLDELLARRREGARDAFVCVEGVYSMDGDLAPLPQIVEVCRRHDAWLIVDDAHGTGVLGENGRGTVEYYGLEGEVDMVMSGVTITGVRRASPSPCRLWPCRLFCYHRPSAVSWPAPPT